MIGQLINNSKVLEKALDATWLRNEAITQNIANADTPNYKKKTVEFEKQLADALEKDSIGSAESGSVQNSSNSKVDDIDLKVTTDNTNLSTRIDGNNVDIESEMADMAKNSLQYNTLAQSMIKQFSMLKYAISEGKR